MTTSNDKKPTKSESSLKEKKKQSNMQHDKKHEKTDRKPPEKAMQSNKETITPKKEQDFDEDEYADYTE